MVPVSPWSPKPGDFSSLNKWSSHEAIFISSRHGAQVQSYGQHDHKDDTWTENKRKSYPQEVVLVGEPCPAAVWAWTSNASHRPRRVADNQGWSNFPKTWEALSSISSISKTAKTKSKSLLLFLKKNEILILTRKASRNWSSPEQERALPSVKFQDTKFCRF